MSPPPIAENDAMILIQLAKSSAMVEEVEFFRMILLKLPHILLVLPQHLQHQAKRGTLLLICRALGSGYLPDHILNWYDADRHPDVVERLSFLQQFPDRAIKSKYTGRNGLTDLFLVNYTTHIVLYIRSTQTMFEATFQGIET